MNSVQVYQGSSQKNEPQKKLTPVSPIKTAKINMKYRLS